MIISNILLIKPLFSSSMFDLFKLIKLSNEERIVYFRKINEILVNKSK